MVLSYGSTSGLISPFLDVALLSWWGKGCLWEGQQVGLGPLRVVTIWGTGGLATGMGPRLEEADRCSAKAEPWFSRPVAKYPGALGIFVSNECPLVASAVQQPSPGT